MIIRNKQLNSQNSSSYSKVYQHTKGGSFSAEKALCNHFPLPQVTDQFSPKQVPVALSLLLIPLLTALCTFIILLTKDNKESLLILKILWSLISQKEKDTVFSLGVCCSDCCFVGQPKREKLSFRSYPSLISRRAQKGDRVILRKKTPKPYISPSFLSSPKKMICIYISFWALPKAAFDRCYLEKWLAREKVYINQALPKWFGAKQISPLLMEDDPGEIAASFQLLRTSLDVFWKQLALQTPVNYVHFSIVALTHPKLIYL